MKKMEAGNAKATKDNIANDLSKAKEEASKITHELQKAKE